MRQRVCSHRAATTSERSGVAMIMAILVLILSTSVCLAMLRTTTLRQSRFVMRLQKQQADLIADSALERVVQQLKKEPGYTGETWNVVASGETGVATMQVQTTSPDVYSVKIVARYPKENPNPAQSTLEVELASASVATQ